MGITGGFITRTFVGADALRQSHLADAAPDLLQAARDALWVLDNVSAIMNAKGLESTLTDPRPALRAAIAKAEAA